MNFTAIAIGLGAGLASALLLATFVSGSPIAIFLAALSLLPLLIAGFGWGWTSALAGAVVASIGLSVATTFGFGAAYFLSIGAPAAWLAYIALLGRPAEESEDAGVRAAGGMEWYPAGRILAALSIMAGALGCLFILQFGFSLDAYIEATRPSVEASLRMMSRMQGAAATGTPAVGTEQHAALVRLMALMLPIVLVAFVFIMLVINTVIAGKIVVRSGRTARPWPDLATTELPRGLLLITLALTLAGLVLPGIVGLFAGLFATTFLFAYFLQGLAVMHVVTRGRPARSLILSFVYFSVLLLSFPGLVIVLVGLLDGLMNIRRRFAAPPAPPPANPFA